MIGLARERGELSLEVEKMIEEITEQNCTKKRKVKISPKQSVNLGDL